VDAPHARTQAAQRDNNSNFKSDAEDFMSLFGQLAGQLLSGALSGGTQQAGSPLLQIAASLLESQGGLGGLLQKFNAAGLGEQAASWVSTGENLPIDASQLSQALGQGTLADLSSQFGLPADQVSGGLAQLLPKLIDKVTPNGSTDGSEALIQQGLSLLGGLLGKTA
jgi:uncharacterized protein YidB (DUF937 family)